MGEKSWFTGRSPIQCEISAVPTFGRVWTRRIPLFSIAQPDRLMGGLIGFRGQRIAKPEQPAKKSALQYVQQRSLYARRRGAIHGPSVIHIRPP